jgi:anaerobic magnesium-protoporphyrin IX monomethyl ester cyclase
VSEILFGQSYFLRFDPKLWNAMQPYPPLGTLYAASYLRSRGSDVALFDAMLAESEEDWATALNRERPRFAVIYEDSFNYLSKMCLLRMREAAFRMIEMARARSCTVVVAGSDATDHWQDYLRRGAHVVLIGEGEITLDELIAALTERASTPLEEIRGLAFRDDRGRLVQTPRRPDLKDLDSLPFPAWDLVDVQRYQDVWRRRHGYYSMNVVTSRGCPFHCNWCAKPIWGQRYNVRSPENVVAEIRWLKSTYQPDHLWFADDIMGLKPGWIQRFAELVEREGVQIPFKSLHRVDLLLVGDTIDALRRAGARTVWVGAESGSQKILDAMEKGTRVEQIHEATRRLHAADIEVGFFVQFGYPGETREDVERTLSMVRECRPDDVGMSVSYPLPGTKFYEMVRLQLGDKQNWIDSDDLDVLYQGPFSTAFYRQLHVVLHKELLARKAGDALLVGLRHVVGQVTGRRVLPGPNPHAGPTGIFSPGATRDRTRAGRADSRLHGRHRPTVRQICAALYHALTLPYARWKLERLARQPHQGIRQLALPLATEASTRSAPATD